MRRLLLEKRKKPINKSQIGPQATRDEAHPKPTTRGNPRVLRCEMGQGAISRIFSIGADNSPSVDQPCCSVLLGRSHSTR